MTLLEFLEQYLRRLEGPVAIQVWGRFLQLAKEVMGSTRDFKPQIFPIFRFVTAPLDDLFLSPHSSFQMPLRAGGQDHTNNSYRR